MSGGAGRPPVAIHLNGEAREADPGMDVREQLLAWGVRLDASAVAIDGVVVPRARLGERFLVGGERIEVIRAVGGG